MKTLSTLLAANALALMAGHAAADDCGACERGKLCAPHTEEERAVLEQLAPALASKAISERIDALREVAELTMEHENAPSEAVAKVLAAGCADESLRVRSIAIDLLTEGQEPETAVVGITLVLAEIHKGYAGGNLVPTLTGEEMTPASVAQAMRYLRLTLRVAGRVRDDKVAGLLVRILKITPTEMRGQPVAMATCDSLLELGTRDSVAAVVRHLTPWEDTREVRRVHDALEVFAVDKDFDGYPEWGRDARNQWKRWLGRHKRALPAKLGKWRPESD